MSHYHLELVMPPTDDVEKRIKEIMAPFSEHIEDDEEGYSRYSFWDWYVIGGRWAGEHLQTIEDPDQLEAFHNELTERSITVSGVVCGKQTLQPADQEAVVDELWREYFPDSDLKACPLFSHFNNQYRDNCLDVDTFDQITHRLSSFMLIIAGEGYEEHKPWRANHMLQREVWNGCSFLETTWDGNVLGGVAHCMSQMEHYREDYREKNTVQNDWLVATVDYHS